jgi:chromosome segregation ATPase
LEKQFQFIAFYNGASFLNRLINSKIQNLKKGKSAAEDQVKSLQADMADSKVSELKKEIKDLKLDLQVKEQTLSIHHKGKVEAENKIKRLEATLSTVSKAIEADLPKST